MYALRSSTPAGRPCQAISALPCCLPCRKQRRPPRSVPFRGSFTQLTHSLCTLRSTGRPVTTQHSVPAGGQPLPSRIQYLLGCYERFQFLYSFFVTSSSPRLDLAHFRRNVESLVKAKKVKPSTRDANFAARKDFITAHNVLNFARANGNTAQILEALRKGLKARQNVRKAYTKLLLNRHTARYSTRHRKIRERDQEIPSKAKTREQQQKQEQAKKVSEEKCGSPRQPWITPIMARSRSTCLYAMTCACVADVQTDGSRHPSPQYVHV